MLWHCFRPKITSSFISIDGFDWTSFQKCVYLPLLLLLLTYRIKRKKKQKKMKSIHLMLVVDLIRCSFQSKKIKYQPNAFVCMKLSNDTKSLIFFNRNFTSCTNVPKVIYCTMCLHNYIGHLYRLAWWVCDLCKIVYK